MFTLLGICIFIGVGLLVSAGILAHTWWTYPLVNELQQPIQRPGLSAVEFSEQSVIIAKDQPQYRPLPALMKRDDTGTMITCWQFTLRDRLKVLVYGKLWCSVWTFNTAISPLYFSVDKSDVIPEPLPSVPEE